MSDAQDPAEELKTTPLDALNRELGGRMVPFAGYAMPVQFPAGIIAEHNQTREKASLFDVSHMGQLRLHGESAATALERLVPGNLEGLKPGRMRYSMLTTDAGTIIDDLMVTREVGGLFVVVNASRFDADLPHMEANIGSDVEIEVLGGRALVALQGPAASAALADLAPDAGAMPFMSSLALSIGGIDALVNRCGYTGEDGYEISVAGADAEGLVKKLLADERVEAAGLGARDTLRLEAGLCLYGQDIDDTTTPIEAGLNWTVPKRRREEGGFPGADIIIDQWENGAARKLVGIRPEGRAPARTGTEITLADGTPIGMVTSGAFGPTIGGPVAMGYVRFDAAETGTKLELQVRGKGNPAAVADLPFASHRYFKA
ncbi:MAG: glycine cleavage system aminomethyltransferase GcvT [Rhodospirillaceae bacterium]|nr:glycine cleavage system aminomethyltransferase GcvT [Rhodospirillaceae bacterium]